MREGGREGGRQERKKVVVKRAISRFPCTQQK